MVKKRQFVKSGNALKPTFERNCMTCKNFMYCNDQNRSAKYLCTKFTSTEDMWAQADRDDAGRIDLANLPFGRKKKKQLDIESDTSEVDTSWLPQGIQSDEKNLRKYLDKQIREGKVKPLESMDADYIDDGDIKLSNNFYHFLRKGLLTGEARPFAKQVEIGIGLMGEWCPRCSDADWLSDVPTDAPLSEFKNRASLLKHGVCRKCGVRKSELIKEGELHDYYTLAGLAGQRASKSVMVGFLTAYQTHRMLKMENPAAEFGVLKGQYLTCHFTAPTWQQAHDNLWIPFSTTLEGSPWFNQYHEMLTHFQNKRGEELFKVMDTFMHYRHKRIDIRAKAADTKTLRGYTRYGGAVDEIGWFGTNVKNIKMNADAVFEALDRSMSTLKQAHYEMRMKGDDIVPQPILACVSSPSSWQDKICRLVKEAEGSKTVYAFHYTSFEINPNLSDKHPEMVERARKDPAGFKRDYLAIPPMSSSEFINDIKKFKALYDRVGFSNPVRIVAKKGTSETGRLMTTARLKPHRWVDQNDRCLALDAGLNNNSFAMAFGRNDPESGYPIIEGMLEVQPIDHKPISFTSMMDDVISPLIEDFGITMVVADRWQSEKLLTDLEQEHGVQIDKHSLRKESFVGYRDDVYEGHMDFPKPEMKLDDILKNINEYPTQFIDRPVSHFLFQNVTVVETPKTVDKGEHLTDDLFRAVVLLRHYLVHPEFKELFLGGNSAPMKKSGLGIASASGAGGAAGQGGQMPGIVVSSMGR